MTSLAIRYSHSRFMDGFGVYDMHPEPEYIKYYTIDNVSYRAIVCGLFNCHISSFLSMRLANFFCCLS